VLTNELIGVTMKKLFILLTVLIGLGSLIPIAAQTTDDQIKTGKMVKRKSENGVDNYVYATYSFKFGGNGPEIARLCGNNWDVIFGNGPTPDAFNVSMVTDDRSRIKDLGQYNWRAGLIIPKLVAYEEPEQEPDVKAVVGHMYLVHSRDRDHNHYALFRVERLVPEESVEISWKMVDGLRDDLAAPSASDKFKTGKIKTGKLLKRTSENGVDNYAYATYSFKCGGNGPEIRRNCHSKWDLLFGNSPTPDAFDVTTAGDDRSRIRDLGKYDWDDKVWLPKLVAYEEPEVEPSVKAVPGHMYLVHTRDTIDNYYVLFRVERLVPNESVEISWEVQDPLRGLVAPSASDDVKTGKIKTAKLQSRKIANGVDNYIYATYSFRFGGNGPEVQRLCLNDWDLLFGNSPTPDAFDVSMIMDDRSRIKDLGRYDWGDKFAIPRLAAYEEPESEPSVRAIAGHMYLVHVRDTDSNHYALFRVERLEPEKSVEISWKLIDPPQGAY
jgi:hypothetical protein